MKKFRAALLPLFAAATLVAAACTPPATGGSSNLRPTAQAAANPTSGQAPLLVQFSSAGSADPDGFIESYEWSFGDGGSTSSAQNPVHTYLTGGAFTATLTITDDGGETATATVLIVVTPPANYPPTAVPVATPTVGKGPLEVSFDSSNSVDVDGTITDVEWDFGDGSPTSADASTTHTYTAVGSYIAALTVTDDQGDANTETIEITVVPNAAPLAVAAGTPSTGKSPLVVSFSSAGSDDTDGSIVSTEWDFGDSTPTDSSASPFHTYTSPGAYVATLTVTDDSGDTDTATVNVTVNANQVPTAVANATPDAGKAPLGVIFSSVGSVDNDGSIVAYEWDFGDGTPFSSSANPSHLYGAEGAYTATLTVTDDDGATSAATVAINVGPPNVTPTIAAVAVPAFGKVPLDVDFSSAGSTDPDGSIVSYEWSFGDGSPNSSAADPSHTYSSVGSFTATLTVTDDDGATATLPVSVDVLANVVPTAVGSATPDQGKEPLEVTFSSAASTDPDGTIAATEWDFGDGTPNSTDAGPTHTYQLPGSYTATLTVTDDSGDSDTTTVNVTVNPNQAPTAVANATSSTSGNAPLTVTFESAASSDPDGTLTGVSWDFGDGTPASTEAAPSHVFTDVGTYTVTLTVTDDNGATSTDTVSIDAEDLVLWVRDGGNDANSGSKTAPFDSIGAALTAAVARNKTDIHVAGGAYDGFTVVDGIDVTGGYDQSFDLGGGDGATEAVVTGAPGSPGVTASGITDATILKGLTIHGGGGANATGVLVQSSSVLTLDTVQVNSGTASGAGSSAYGVRALSGSTVTVLGSHVTAQDGVQGVQGNQGANGTNGANGIASTGNPVIGTAPGGVSAGGTGLARSGKGANGAQNILGSTDGSVGEKGGDTANAGDGGGAGGIKGVNALWGGGGGGGGTTNGPAGAAGSAGATTVGAAGDTYVGVAAGTGGASGVGAGGGGGGSGRANATRSGAGGSGGVGGNGGAGGTGGIAGGGSFALFSHDATITVDNTTLTTGIGGTGGTGGKGGTGGTGGTGGPGMSVGSVGGGGGGGGGAGGRGGSGGGGGAGGPSVAAFHSGTGTQTLTGLTTSLGSGGAGGDGGAGGNGGSGGAGGALGTGAAGRDGFPGGVGATGSTGGTGSTGNSGVVHTTWDNGVTG